MGFSIGEYFASVNVNGKYYQLKNGENNILNVKFNIELENKAEGLYSWLINVENDSDEKSPRIKELLGLDYTFKVKGATVFNTLRGDDCTITSFFPESFVLKDGQSVRREPIGGRSSSTTAFPYLDIKDESDSGIVCGIGWSGQWQLDVFRNGDEVRLAVGFKDCDFILNPHEKVRSVRILIYFGKGNENELRQKFVRNHREHYSVFPNFDEGFFPIAIQCFDRYYWGNTPKEGEINYVESEEAHYVMIDSAYECGYFNSNWLDANWFEGAFRTGVGNYRYAKGFPNGLKPISDYAHKKGMKFILWFEPVRCDKDTDVANALGYDKTKIIPLEGQNRMLVNLGDEEVLQYQLDNVSRIIEENGVDIYRQDYNLDPYDYLKSIETPDRVGISQIRFTEGIYKLWDGIKKRFPNIIIDNCASGGRLIDVETNMRSIPLWRSDMACRPSPAGMQNETLGLSKYIPYHHGSSFDYSAYFLRSSMTTGIGCEFSFLEGHIDPIKQENSLKAVCAPHYLISEVKNNIVKPEVVNKQFKELLKLKEYWKGDFTPLTPPSDKFDANIAYMLNMPNEDRGVILAFRREEAPESFVIKLSSVCENKNYKLILSDEDLVETTKVVSGKELLEGLTVKIEKTPGSLVIYYSVEK